MRKDVLEQGFVDLVSHMGDELSIVNAARVSFGKHTNKLRKRDIKLIKYLWDNRHSTPFEMVEFCFRVKCPMYVRSQWHRHRTWSYNEISRRYTSDDLGFQLPQVFRLQDDKNKQGSKDEIEDSKNQYFRYHVHKANTLCYTLYNEMIDAGIAREQARIILPQNMWTEFYAKVDLHNLLHFLRLRLDPHAQWEIRQYAKAMLEFVEEILPNVAEFFKDGLDYEI